MMIVKQTRKEEPETFFGTIGACVPEGTRKKGKEKNFVSLYPLCVCVDWVFR